MPNIQTLKVLQDFSGAYIGGSSIAIDLEAVIAEGTYLVNSGASIQEYSYPKAGSKFGTKLTNLSNQVAYLNEGYGVVANLIAADSTCAACDAATPSQPVEIISSCAKPVFVQLCDPSGRDEELVFTSAVAVCVDNGGVKVSWLTRERIVWDSVTYTEVSRATEYSSDGITWSSTAPTGTIKVGSCVDAPITSTDYEYIVTTPVDICAKYHGGDNATNCSVDGYIYENWLVREVIKWDSITGLEISRAVEYSKDGVIWVATAPENYFLGECPEVMPVDEIPVCEISEAFGNDLSTLKSGKSFSITKPSCCKIKITTDIGSFHVLDGIQHYSSSDFTCPFNITNVEIVGGTCTLDKVHIISNNF
jgi:hypothetical protein